MSKNLNANAKSWTPNVKAKEWTPQQPAAAPVANSYQNNGGYQQPYYQPAPQYALPYLDINGFPVYPMVPSIMQYPNGEFVQMGVVPNPQYAPPGDAVFVPFDYIPPVVSMNYADPNAIQQHQQQLPAPTTTAAAAAPAAPQIADVAAAAPAATVTPAESVPATTAAPVAAAAEPLKTAAAPVVEAPKAATEPAAAAPTAASVVHEKLSIETPNSVKETTDADHRVNGKLVYDKTVLIAFYEKASIGAADTAIKNMYGNFANKSRDPIGFYFSTMKGSNSHANLASNNSSNSLTGMRGKGNDDGRLERGQKVEGRKDKHMSKARQAEQERRERAERDDELYYNDAGTPLPSPAAVGYKSVFKVVEDDVEATVRKSNLILNKLSVTKFDKLSDEFMAVGLLETPQLMARAVDLIVLKAQMEEHFCFMYADLCNKIVKQGTAIMPEKVEDGVAAAKDAAASPAPDAAGDDEAGEGAKPTGPRTMGEIFRSQLLERCQQEFESDRVQGLEAIRNNAEFSADEKVEKEIGLKKRYTGTMRFIGELFIKDLIRANTMCTCLDSLLACTEEDELVCMAKLFQTIGLQLENFYADKAKACKTKSKRAKNEAVIPQYLAQIEKLAEEHSSSRVRYMMRDLIDLQSNKWIPRREADKVVSLENKTVTTPASNYPEQPNSPKQPSESWTTVGATAKSKSSASLSSMASAMSSYANSGANKTANSGGSKFAGSDSKGPGNATPKGGAGGFQRSTSSNAVSGAGGRPPQQQPSPRGGPGSKGAGFGGKSGGKPLPSESTVTVKPGSTPAAAVTETPAAPAVDESAPFDKESATFKRIKSTVEEYYMNNLMEEVFIVLGELPIPQSHLQEILKYLIIGSLEKTDANRSALAKLIIAMHSNGVLSNEHVTNGLLQFLNEYDDIVIDVPLAGAYATGFIGELIASGCTSLFIFKDIPEENNFSFHAKIPEFITQVLATAAKFRPESEVKELLAESGIDLKAALNVGPRENRDEVYAEVLKKYNASFLA